MQTNKLSNIRLAKERKRLDGVVPDYPASLPDLRCKITIERYDCGETHVLELYKTNRIDCYRVVVDGKLWRLKIGLSRILEQVRKAMPRIRQY